jgi:alkanesulfonate monooxygenase SsuD/methylene tetrahydromethanopterin reductase-like flavin-dependent oxidoreductase (luciferase family)
MAARRPIGRDNDAYQAMLDSLVELATVADDLGYWGLAHTEHHLHSEGMEVSPSPLMLNIHLGAHTKRIMHGQLGLVLPSHDPIRLAEEIAIADHMLRGRLFVGMARGYQSRWMNILCQKFGVGATYSDGSEADRSNRVLFAENFKIIKQAWAEDLLTHDGPTYKIPHPVDGIADWPPAQTITSRDGAPGEIGEDGTTVRGVSVVPRPYQQPHPPLFQAFGASPRACAARSTSWKACRVRTPCARSSCAARNAGRRRSGGAGTRRSVCWTSCFACPARRGRCRLPARAS